MSYVFGAARRPDSPQLLLEVSMNRAASALKIFLVEDVEIIRDSLILALEDVIQAEIVGAVSTENEAVEWLQQHPLRWEIAVIDLFLPQGSGLGVLRVIKHRSQAQIAVVLSNYVTVDTKARCMAAGADFVFDKSTEIDAFLDCCAGHRGRGLDAGQL